MPPRLGASAGGSLGSTRAITRLPEGIRGSPSAGYSHRIAQTRNELPPSHAPNTRIVAITGSCGKTTTKEMIAAVLGQRVHVVKTDGNKNNQVGLPLNLLRLDPCYDFGVFELGTTSPVRFACWRSCASPKSASSPTSVWRTWSFRQ